MWILILAVSVITGAFIIAMELEIKKGKERTIKKFNNINYP